MNTFFYQKSFLLIYFFFFYFEALSQNSISIPTGTWRTHFDYSNVKLISFFDNKLYASASKGVFYFDFEDNSINKVTNIDGLGSTGVSALYSNSELLFIGYRTGYLDIIYKSGGIKTLNLFAGFINPEIDKTINDILIKNNFIYASTNLGVVVIDLHLLEILEIYNNIGSEGKAINSLETKIISDSIFILSDVGLFKSIINSEVNLKDYRNWKLVNLPDSLILGSAILNNNLFVYNENKLFEYDENNFKIFKSFSNKKIKKIKKHKNELLAISSNSIFLLNINKEINLKYENKKFSFNDALIINNNLWGAVENDGIINLENNKSFKIHSSIGEDVLKLLSSKNFIIGLKYSKEINEPDSGFFSLFDGQIWSNNNLDSFSNLISTAINNSNDMYFASFGYGIYDTKNKLIFDEKSIGSTLKKIDPNTNSLYITDIIFDNNDNLYVANYGVESSLHILEPEGVWTKFSFSNLKYQYPLDIHLGMDGIIWSRLDIKFGGGILVFDKVEGKSIWLNKQNNKLLDNNISSIAIDREDKVWVGTSRGMVFFNKSKITDNNEKGLILSIDGNNFLDNEVINSIAVDSGNRKWIASNNGVWLINSTNNLLVLNFNTKNSPLPSDKVLDIEIDHNSGEVFFLSEHGLISYMSDAVKPKKNYSEIKIFPNPVSLKKHNVVSFYNLIDNSKIKIMTLSGRIIDSFYSNGGGASWNLLDMNGNIILPGIYLIFLSDNIGNDSFIQKILITE